MMTYGDRWCHLSPHHQWATNALHHWLLTPRSLAIFCFFSLLHIPDLLSLFLRIAFLLEVDCCWSRTAAVTCETNSLEYGQKFPIAEARLLTLTPTWKGTQDESSRRQVFSCVRFRCVKSGLHGCALAKYEHASRAREPVNRIRQTSFQHATGEGACCNLCPRVVRDLPEHEDEVVLRLPSQDTHIFAHFLWNEKNHKGVYLAHADVV